MILLRECARYECKKKITITSKNRTQIYCCTSHQAMDSNDRAKMNALLEGGLNLSEIKEHFKYWSSYKVMYMFTSCKERRKPIIFIVANIKNENRIPSEDYLLTHRAKYPPMNYALPTQESETIGEFYRKEIT